MKPFKKIYYIACDLERSTKPEERQLSVVLHKASHALHDIQMGENAKPAIVAAERAMRLPNLLNVID